MRRVFIKATISLIGDYQKYLTSVNGIPIFNSITFIENKPKKDSDDSDDSEENL